MISKINNLKTSTSITEVKALCESAISLISSAIYKGVTKDAQLEIENYSITNLFEGLKKYSNDKEVAAWLDNQKRIYSLKNLGVRNAVKRLLETETKHNFALSNILEGYREQIENGVPEVLLYEGFVSALSGYNYISAVDTELSAVAERIKKYKNDIDITKIIEVMKGTRSEYLVPLIEDLVDNYLSDKNQQSKSSLKECLVKFSYDPFIRDLLNVLMLDATGLQLEYANSACEIEDKLYSPVVYLGENEALFNIHGTYYVKKGNNISRIKNADISKLDESFVNLCNLLNLPTVEISNKDIKLYMGKDSAIITESEIIINGANFTRNQINENMTAAMWAGNEAFFNTVTTLKDNFNEIAELDFVKRVYLKQNENYAADIFKLRDNIFITTFDPINAKTTFYRNINPIHADKIMMEHMRFDVSKTFAEILPNKDKILLEVSETKREYIEYIQMLENKISEFSANNNPTQQAVVSLLKEELAEVKLDYKSYSGEVNAFININENLNITVQDDGTGKSYTVVVPTGAMASKGNGGGVTGAEHAEGDSYGTEVGMSSIAPGSSGASSAVTFDDDQSELLSDQPTMPEDEVDLGADDTEAYADKVDAETELEAPETAISPESGPEADAGLSGTEGGPDLGGADTGVEGDNGNDQNTELDLDLGTETEDVTDMDPNAQPAAETPEENPEEKAKEEGVGAPTKNLERTAFDKDKNPGDLQEPKKIKKVFLKRTKKL